LLWSDPYLPAILDAVFAEKSTPDRVCLGNGSGGFSCIDVNDIPGFTRSVVLGELIYNLIFDHSFE
jgi:hypothetical protein